MLSREDPRNLLTIGHDIATIIQTDLKKLGMYKGTITSNFDDSTRKVLEDFVNIHNFENRMHDDAESGRAYWIT